MRVTPWLLILAACGTSQQPVAPEPVRAPICEKTVTPECPTPECPKVECPACPECPAPEKPVVWDWHCLDLKLADGNIFGYCFPQAHSCTSKRQKAIDKKWGKPSACTTQRVAHCFVSMSTTDMHRQWFCARTAEDCKARRKTRGEHQSEDETTSPCRPTLNTDRYTEHETSRTDWPGR